MTATLSPSPVFQWIGANGQPLVGGLLYSYAAGTSTPLATYTDATGSVANPNPVVLDASGSAPVWLASAAYKLVLEDTFGDTLWAIDNINAVQQTYLSAQGGTAYQPGSNTTISVNSDPGLTSTFQTEINGVPSTRFYSTTQGKGGIGAANGMGAFGVDALTFDSSGNVSVGNALTVGQNTATAVFMYVNGAAGSTRFIEFATAGLTRWVMACDGEPESGSNTGSNFILFADADNGSTVIGNAFLINRATLACTTGGVWQGPNFIANSDRRLKKSVKDINRKTAWKWIKAIRSVWFTWRRSGKRELGYIAQEFRSVCPFLVHEDAYGNLGIDYDKVSTIHTVALQDLLQRVEALEAKVHDLTQ